MTVRMFLWWQWLLCGVGFGYAGCCDDDNEAGNYDVGEEIDDVTGFHK